MQKKFAIVIWIAGLLVILSGCTVRLGYNGDNDDRDYVEIDEDISFEQDIARANTLELNYDLGIAEFSLEGVEGSVISAEAHYNEERLLPKFELQGDDDVTFKIFQKKLNNLGKFNPDCTITNTVPAQIPANINLDMGVGMADLDLSNINLGELKIDGGVGEFNADVSGIYDQEVDASINGGVGAIDLNFTGTFNDMLKVDADTGLGEIKLDLNGDFKKDVYVDVEGGIGSVKMTLPSNVGIKIEGKGGLASIKIKDNEKKIDTALSDVEYTNDLYGVSDVTIYVQVETGLGEMDINIK